MFNIHPIFLEVSARNVEAWQNASDAKTLAMNAIEKIAISTASRFQMPAHPWHARDGELIQMTLYVAAYANDVAAEYLYQDNVETRLGKTMLPKDIASFAEAASGMAAESVEKAMAIDPSGQFDLVGIREEFTPHALTPFWPHMPTEGELPEWQSYDKPEVSLDFMRGMVKAARDVQTQTRDCGKWYIQDVRKEYGKYIPDEYNEGDFSVENVVLNNIISGEVEGQLNYAEGFLMQKDKIIPDDELPAIYDRVHGGYNGAVYGLMSIIAPFMLGPDYMPKR